MPRTRQQLKDFFDAEAKVLGGMEPQDYTFTNVIVTHSATGQGTHKRWIYPIDPTPSSSSQDQFDKMVEPVTPKKRRTPSLSPSSSLTSSDSWSSETHTLAEPHNQADADPFIIDHDEPISFSPPPAPKINRMYTTEKSEFRIKRDTDFIVKAKEGESLTEFFSRINDEIADALEATENANKLRIAARFKNDTSLQRLVAVEVEHQKELIGMRMQKNKDENPFVV